MAQTTRLPRVLLGGQTLSRVQKIRQHLQRRGFQKEFIRQEIYWVPKKAAK